MKRIDFDRYAHVLRPAVDELCQVLWQEYRSNRAVRIKPLAVSALTLGLLEVATVHDMHPLSAPAEPDPLEESEHLPEHFRQIIREGNRAMHNARMTLHRSNLVKVLCDKTGVSWKTSEHIVDRCILEKQIPA